jgi:hypothetical protein
LRCSTASELDLVGAVSAWKPRLPGSFLYIPWPIPSAHLGLNVPGCGKRKPVKTGLAFLMSFNAFYFTLSKYFQPSGILPDDMLPRQEPSPLGLGLDRRHPWLMALTFGCHGQQITSPPSPPTVPSRPAYMPVAYCRAYRLLPPGESGRYADARRADEGASDFAPVLDPRKVSAIGHPWRLNYAGWKPAVQLYGVPSRRQLKLPIPMAVPDYFSNRYSLDLAVMVAHSPGQTLRHSAY